MRRVMRDHGLAATMFGFFLVFWIAQILTGHNAYNHEQTDHGAPAVGLSRYLRTGHVVEATFENWESEYLQMAAYVLLTAFLFERGSSESKDPDSPEVVDEDPRTARNRPGVPWPVRRGGAVLVVYNYSLSLALFLLFLISFGLHAAGGAREFSEGQIAHGGEAVSTLGFMRTAEFWFQSFQNWQSEFLAVGSIVVLSIVLRHKGSPESKPVAAPHKQTGTG